MNRKRTHSESDSEFKLNKKIKYQGCAIILMGLPGSGKSYLSPKIINHINKIVDNQYQYINLNPDNVGVYVMGNVRFPGIKSLNKQSGVIEAIEIAGGYNTPFNGNISFIRFNADGSIDKRKISPRTKAKRGSYMNPYLLEGDIVSVKLGKITKTANALRTIADPFAAYLQILGLYQLVKD